MTGVHAQGTLSEQNWTREAQLPNQPERSISPVSRRVGYRYVFSREGRFGLPCVLKSTEIHRAALRVPLDGEGQED